MPDASVSLSLNAEGEAPHFAAHFFFELCLDETLLRALSAANCSVCVACSRRHPPNSRYIKSSSRLGAHGVHACSCDEDGHVDDDDLVDGDGAVGSGDDVLV